MKIRELPDILISQIAAGEVIERPASVVKELVENSIDSGASEIVVKIENAGKNLIQIADNGSGISKDDLKLSITRHATSKIKGNNLLDIESLGFRGEGLASIAAISKLEITSRPKEQNEAYKIESEGGKNSEIEIANLSAGTIVKIRDLFYATPARLKFLKADKTENSYITEFIKKIALANPNISFKLFIDDKEIVNYQKSDSLSDRIAQIIGKEFINNSVEVDYQFEDYKFSGRISLPTYSRASANLQYSFVNSRMVKDKIIYSALKASYSDYLANDRYPICVIFLEIPKLQIDVNVHPAKTEIRFRDSQKIRNMLITAFKSALQGSGFKAAPKIADMAVTRFAKNTNNYNFSAPRPSATQNSFANFAQTPETPNLDFSSQEFAPTSQNFSSQLEESSNSEEYKDYPLGSAVAQIHKTYILSQTKEGLIIVDQHAAHERLVYEKLKKSLAEKEVTTQKHLFSEIVELEETTLNALLEKQEELKKYGVTIEQFGKKGVMIKETPEVFKEIDIKGFIKDLADNIHELGEALNIKEKFTEIYGNHACRNSVRAGRKLNIGEMNHLLREMEQTPFSGQCNHGRPTYIELKKGDLEVLFDRK